MELISRVSKGTKMDQVYIPKRRKGFAVGEHVLIKPLGTKEIIERPYLYNIKQIEPIKIEIINELFASIDKELNYDNIIITGSFLDKGFSFNDIDILIISENNIDEKHIKKILEDRIKIKVHILSLSNRILIEGLSTDPLYLMMLSKCVSKKRIIYNIKPRIDYKLLDYHLLKSRLLIDNFDYLNGNEKYYLIRNMISISLYLRHKRISKEEVDKDIISVFGLKNIDEIKLNMLDRNKFLKKYKIIYKNTFNEIMNSIKNGPK